MTTKPKMNVRLLRRIQKQIAKEPRQFYMGWWFVTGSYGLPWKIPNCGTAACVAGWAISLAKKVSPKVARKRLEDETDAYEDGREALGLTEEQANRLFGVALWPWRFQFTGDQEGTPAAAKLAIARIDHFIKTKGRY